MPYNVVNTCDLDKDSVLSYAAMRYDLEEEMKNFDFPSKEEMIAILQEKNVGLDFKTGKQTINDRTNIDKLKLYYLADHLGKNLGDISKVERLPYVDLVTYSFPCTTISVSGKGEGIVNKCDCGYSWPIDFSNSDEALTCPQCGATVTSSTQSGLLGQVQRLLAVAYKDNTLPPVLLMENVKNLVGKKFKPQFDSWLQWLDSIGYNTYWKVLNGKHYGIPQNRERCFAISILKNQDNGEFEFPETIPLTTRLKDMLEKNVDEKYYLPDDRVEKIINSSFMKEKKLAQMKEGIAPALTTMGGGNREPSTVTAIAEPFVVASRGRNPENPSDRTVGAPTEQRLEPNFSGTTNCLTSVAKDNYVCEPVIESKKGGHNKTHNMSNTRIYNIWSLMKRRCFNENASNYEYYGGRGITVCESWLHFEGFYEWAINNGYQEDLTIERIDNDGNYEPDNCKWVDFRSQVNNRRNWGEVEYYGIVKDNTGYRAQVTVDGKKIYIAHSTDDIEYLVNERNKYIDEHNLPNKKNIFKKSSEVELEPIIYDDYNSRISADQDAINTLTCNCGASAERNDVKIIEPIVCEERKDEGIRLFKDDCVGTLRTIDACGDKRVIEPEVTEPPKIKWRIRKLTPKETNRLMNFTDKDYEAMSKYVSNSAIYKANGNSIIVACLIAIFSSLFIENGYKADVWTKYQLHYND